MKKCFLVYMKATATVYTIEVVDADTPEEAKQSAILRAKEEQLDWCVRRSELSTAEVTEVREVQES